MPVPVPNLDDRTFDQLAAEARALIPRHFPVWTDHNDSDPGITLLQLFAFLVEALFYQVNLVPERSLENFARLVGVTRGSGEPVERTLRRALELLALKYRAITAAEFEALAQKVLEAVSGRGGRVKAIVEVLNTANVFPDEQFVRLVVVPDVPGVPNPMPTPGLRQAVFEGLEPRRLLTTRVQVIGPDYTGLDIAVLVARDAAINIEKGAVEQNVEQALRNFFDVFIGGVGGRGWEFGRPVFRAELYQLIEGVAGVDSVRRLWLEGDELIGEVPLRSINSLVRLDALSVSVVDPF